VVHRRKWLLVFTLLSVGLIALSAGTALRGQQSGGSLVYADGTSLKVLGPRTVLLTWDAYQADPCKFSVTYNVYRGESEDFQPSPENEIANDLLLTSYTAHEPIPEHDYFYWVTVNLTPTVCAPRSGLIQVFPLDLGEQYKIIAGTLADTCTAQSTTEIWCPTISQRFHAVIIDSAN